MIILFQEAVENQNANPFDLGQALIIGMNAGIVDEMNSKPAFFKKERRKILYSGSLNTVFTPFAFPSFNNNLETERILERLNPGWGEGIGKVDF